MADIKETKQIFVLSLISLHFKIKPVSFTFMTIAPALALFTQASCFYIFQPRDSLPRLPKRQI
jgi:hypothetical protein